MSDILEKLLGVEKNASVLITEADAEANRRKTAARMDAQKNYTRLLAEKAAESDAKFAEARERLARERDEKNRKFAEGLLKHGVDIEAFRRAVIAGIGKTR
jgi:F0F1-type ATP synthase membrane subunit b/b'